MRTGILGNILSQLSDGGGFVIYGDVDSQADFDAQVVFQDSTKK